MTKEQKKKKTKAKKFKRKTLLILSITIFAILTFSTYFLIEAFRKEDKVAFSGKCERMVIEAINNSKSTLDIAIYSLTDDKIVEALKNASQRGVKIRILADRLQATTRHSKITDLYNDGLKIRVNTTHQIEHNKFAIFDKTAVISGSYNWTNNATYKNSENCVWIVENNDIIEEYDSRFAYLWQINTKKNSEKWFNRKINSKQDDNGLILDKPKVNKNNRIYKKNIPVNVAEF